MCLASTAILLFTVIPAIAEDKPAKAKPGDKPAMTEEEMMAAWAKYAQPGEPHKKLQAMAGSWNFTTRWWQDPSAAPTESKGTSEAQTILGGRFVQESVTGEMQGSPFHGIGITGYDNFKQKYVTMWMDEMSTTVMISYGTPDVSGKVITFEGTYDDLATGQKDKKFKSISRIVNDDKHIYESYEYGADGKEFKNFDVTYSRKK